MVGLNDIAKDLVDGFYSYNCSSPIKVEVYGVGFDSDSFRNVEKIVGKMRGKIGKRGIIINVCGEKREHQDYYGIDISKFLPDYLESRKTS